jgi:hypothetical protein
VWYIHVALDTLNLEYCALATLLAFASATIRVSGECSIYDCATAVIISYIV